MRRRRGSFLREGELRFRRSEVLPRADVRATRASDPKPPPGCALSHRRSRPSAACEARREIRATAEPRHTSLAQSRYRCVGILFFDEWRPDKCIPTEICYWLLVLRKIDANGDSAMWRLKGLGYGAADMATSTRLTIQLDDELARILGTAASERSLAPERVAADCVAQHFEISARFLALLERFEQIDNNLAVIAHFVGEASVPADGVDLWKICRYRREK
jgi:hypothetical protein